ncbi:MAG TPA: DUF3368 domain-containing protein [Anaerolineales bacterium]|nr:DUF3368 domain-containing protein [Anaerolineales bacterium]
MLVVSNTSPILNLAIVRRLDLLRLQFETVLIPPAVREELRLDSELPGVSEAQAALQSGWLRESAPSNTTLVQTLSLELDGGEAAAIALALEIKPEFILMDETEGRAKAVALGLRPVGILGVLLRAKRDGQIDSVKEIMTGLRQEAGFFIADDLFDAVLREAGEV